MINAMHVLSTAPFFAKPENSGAYIAEKFDVYCALLSALSWRRLGGKITLRTDAAGAEYFFALGITDAWDDIRGDLPSDFAEMGIDPLMFWAAGKLFALMDTQAPVAVLDTDFIVWEMPPLADNVVAAHAEDITEHIYPPPSYFKMKPGYIHQPGFDYFTLPSNTAFLYMPSESFKQFYVAKAVEFMKQAEPDGDYLRYMVFAEQRMLSLCAKFAGAKIEYLLDKNRLFMPQTKYTHLWGAKHAMRSDPIERERFCVKCRKRLFDDFPEQRYLLDKLRENDSMMK